MRVPGLASPMAGARCDHCGVEEYMPYVCKFCKGRFCAAHRLPENHACAGLGAHRERMRAEGRVFAPSQSEPVQPRVSRAARAGGMLDAFWSKVDGKMTYVFLGIIVAVFLLEYVVLGAGGGEAFESVFVIRSQEGSPLFWLTQPWTVLTSVFAHDPGQLNHILFNSLALLFFGHTVERLIGTRRYTWLFLGAGALAGVAQVLLMYAVFGDASGALGASGALQGVMGTLVVLAPTLSVLVFFIVPAPLWALVVLYVLLDVVGFVTPDSPVANVAHLAGLAVGLAFGYHLRRKGLRAVVQPRPPIRRYL